MHLIFLPGAGGAADFWHPLGALLPGAWRKTYLSWPGLGIEPHDARVNGFDDLVALAEREIAEPAVVVAQSMGGVVAIRLALKHPDMVSQLVLVATSGGVDVSALGGADWRSHYVESFPESQLWITTDMPDHAPDMAQLATPTLLVWGEDDLISPPAVGRHLAGLIRDAVLYVIPDAAHDLGRSHAAQLASHVLPHLS